MGAEARCWDVRVSDINDSDQKLFGAGECSWYVLLIYLKHLICESSVGRQLLDGLMTICRVKLAKKGVSTRIGAKKRAHII